MLTNSQRLSGRLGAPRQAPVQAFLLFLRVQQQQQRRQMMAALQLAVQQQQQQVAGTAALRWRCLTPLGRLLAVLPRSTPGCGKLAG